LENWKELEARFRELEEPLRWARAHAKWREGEAEDWSLVCDQGGTLRFHDKQRFEATVCLAGEKLKTGLQHRSAGEHAGELRAEPDSLRRWYKALLRIGGEGPIAVNAFDHSRVANVRQPARASALLCLRLASMLPDGQEGAESRVERWLARGRRHPVAVALVAVVGLLAVLGGIAGNLNSLRDLAAWLIP